MYINRKIEEEALNLLKFFPILGITGPRQVGKTTLARQLQKLIKKESIYLDLESTADYSLLQESELFLKRNEGKCIIIDEIQRMPALFPLLRSLVDRNRVPARFILLGSASPNLIRDSSESLAGRIAYLNLMTFSLTEIPEKISWQKHWLTGGFPEPLLSDDPYFSFKWYENFVRTYIERDIPNLGFQINTVKLERILRLVASLHGQILNYATIARAVDFSVTYVKTILNILEQAYLLVTLSPFFVNTQKRLVKSPKVYIRDSGLLHYLLNVQEEKQLLSNAILGASWEGYVIEQIRNNINSDYRLFFYRTQDQSEMDLIIEKGNEVTASVEIKYSASPKLSKGNTMAIQTIACKNNFIITPDSRDYLLKENVRVCSLRTFLEKYLPVNFSIVS